MENLRSIQVKKSLPQIDYGARGYFHRWCDEPFFDASLSYPLSKTFALIEFVDGSVRFLEPEAIQFDVPYRPSK